MDHVVYVDAKARELEKLLSGEKTMIVRGATGRKLPYGRVESGDCLFFVENNGEGIVHAGATAGNVFNSEKLTEAQAAELLRGSQSKLNLTPEQFKRWSGKRYLVLIEVRQAQAIDPFAIDRSQYGNMDDWLVVNNIESVKSNIGN
ncbi:MAG: hypothetical protein ACM3PS_06980 [Syntrophothermus sp.]